MDNIFIGTSIALMLLVFVCLYRAIIGPRAIDRVISINIIGTKALVIISLISLVFNETFFIDVAVVYALISFIMTIGVSKYIDTENID
ncbi:cation:proton antiporter [Alkalicella caledoniensis]|uniref:Cation:proton antiporter n=1 Tax=Alkalicella caledoniensis TaxID=2731377 RepID=A0A7G9W4L4_ALKCA|nr:monovalent cation/H+ antiporter complex subunit F [Alkalicella caledoniensis]QNO13626.1 cation:proton antiporter [Alkalicella caledoniensis]